MQDIFSGILREFDEEDVDCIYSEAFDTAQNRTGNYDRLLRLPDIILFIYKEAKYDSIRM